MSFVTEAIREWAWIVGAYPRNVASQWLLSDYDSWERNPHYTGPDQGHPEDDDYTPEQLAAREFAERCADDTRDVEYWAAVPYLRVR